MLPEPRCHRPPGREVDQQAAGRPSGNVQDGQGRRAARPEGAAQRQHPGAGLGANGIWTPHDLRRTGATMMRQLGVSLDIIDRCQNHILHGSKVRRHYMHHDYANEKRAAWAALGTE